MCNSGIEQGVCPRKYGVLRYLIDSDINVLKRVRATHANGYGSFTYSPRLHCRPA